MRMMVVMMTMVQDGLSVKSTLDSSSTVQYGALVAELAQAARGVVGSLIHYTTLLALHYKHYTTLHY